MPMRQVWYFWFMENTEEDKIVDVCTMVANDSLLNETRNSVAPCCLWIPSEVRWWTTVSRSKSVGSTAGLVGLKSDDLKESAILSVVLGYRSVGNIKISSFYTHLCSPPDKFRNEWNVVECMLTASLDKNDHVAFVPNVQQNTDTKNWYVANIRPKVLDSLTTDCAKTQKRENLLHHDNAPEQTLRFVIDFPEEPLQSLIPVLHCQISNTIERNLLRDRKSSVKRISWTAKTLTFVWPGFVKNA